MKNGRSTLQENMLNKKFNHNRVRGEKYSRAGMNSKRGGIVLDDYMNFIKETQMGDRHHWLSKGNYGTFDCFIVCVHPDLHERIHHGDIGVKGYIEQEGFEELVLKSMELLYSYLDTCRTYNDKLADALTLFMADVLSEPSKALDIAKEHSERIMDAV